jgi:hypothetical protein
MFIPVSRHADLTRWSFDFAPEIPGQDPACWAGVAEGSAIRFDPRSGRLMIFESGKHSARYAHELVVENERRSDWPVFAPHTAGSEPSGPGSPD